jgi:hypothetical protein
MSRFNAQYVIQMENLIIKWTNRGDETDFIVTKLEINPRAENFLWFAVGFNNHPAMVRFLLYLSFIL